MKPFSNKHIPLSEITKADDIFDPCRSEVKNSNGLRPFSGPCTFTLVLSAIVRAAGPLDVDMEVLEDYIKACHEGIEDGPSIEGMTQFVARELKVVIGETTTIHL